MKTYCVIYDTLDDKGLSILVDAPSVEEAKQNACSILQKDEKTFRIKYVLDVWGQLVVQGVR